MPQSHSITPRVIAHLALAMSEAPPDLLIYVPCELAAALGLLVDTGIPVQAAELAALALMSLVTSGEIPQTALA